MKSRPVVPQGVAPLRFEPGHVRFDPVHVDCPDTQVLARPLQAVRVVGGSAHLGQRMGGLALLGRLLPAARRFDFHDFRDDGSRRLSAADLFLYGFLFCHRMGDSTGHERAELALKRALQNPGFGSKMGPNNLMSYKLSGFGPLKGHQNSRFRHSLQDIRDVM